MADWEWRLKRGSYLGEISALCFLHPPPPPSQLSSLPFLVAGTGSQIILYDLAKRKMISSFEVFDGIRVHGICCYFVDCSQGLSCAFKIAVFGERRVKLFGLSIETTINSQNQHHLSAHLILLQSLPKFSHWVLDVCFLKGYASSLPEGSYYLAIGCSDNSVHFWDMSTSNLNFEVRCPERCLLYSMRMWGNEVEALCIAAGTILNEVIVWKVVRKDHDPCLDGHLEDHRILASSFHKCLHLHGFHYEATCICKLAGHEGSILRLSWSCNGSKLVSVSDDRSARIWKIFEEKRDLNGPTDAVSDLIGTVLFGHDARVWDCCIHDSLIITAGEDCTCRVWGLDGAQVMMIKEHIGRGVWRCLYDPNSQILVTAGFDSAIKLYQLHTSLSKGLSTCLQEVEDARKEVFAIRIPTSTEQIGLMDSKSEYVRCLQFMHKDALYVATNNGYLYHALLSDGGVTWTELARVSKQVPIVCMSLLSYEPSNSCGFDDWIAVGDGKGNTTIVRVVGEVRIPKVALSFTWSAGMERQLLGTYWCKALGERFVFAADPRGTLKLWRLSDTSNTMRINDVSLVAEFKSCFEIRIVCVDASFSQEVLVCGDLRGNVLVFPLLRGMLLGTDLASEAKIAPLTYFKGAHGISTVSSVLISGSSPNQAEIHSTGADGCICYFIYGCNQRNLEFIGMKQVKELSLVQSVFHNVDSYDDSTSGNWAVGFASANFIIMNLSSETKVVQIPCGGWRRPHSYYLGDVPEMKNCFAFVKDEVIHIHRHWAQDSKRQIYPWNLHLQFHGQEMHTLCFIPDDLEFCLNDQMSFSESVWISTGCEDGTMRLTRYAPGAENWSGSKLLGEHVGGSAIRSICCVSSMHVIGSDMTNVASKVYRQNMMFEDQENPFLLISVGAKRVLTVWKRNIRIGNKDPFANGPDSVTENCLHSSSGISYSMSFQWLSTDMPMKSSGTHRNGNKIEQVGQTTENVCGLLSLKNRKNSETCLGDKYENDWRYLAVTAFLVKIADSRTSVCFVTIACSDATVAVRAFILPYRLWFDIGFFVPLASPVIALQHMVIPLDLPMEGKPKSGSIYVVISGSTDGSIAFWDLTEYVESFMRLVSSIPIEKFIDCQRRPRTGRGSQGGRWWRSLGSRGLKQKLDGLASEIITEKTGNNMENHVGCGKSFKWTDPSDSVPCSEALLPGTFGSEVSIDDFSPQICEIKPLHVLHNSHQSGVNCLHVSKIKDVRGSKFQHSYAVVSGGDDQALVNVRFDWELQPLNQCAKNIIPEMDNAEEPGASENFIPYFRNPNYRIRFFCHDKITSAHSSAVKGIWTDGRWVFSIGLDQRMRCWHIEEDGKLTEHGHKIVSVPEPEALDARARARDHYEIAIAGRGMQMVEFVAVGGMDGGEKEASD